MNHSNPSPSLSLAQLLQHFFVERLSRQLRASPHTVRSYRDSFRQFLVFASKHLRQPPSRIVFEQIDAPLVSAFLDDIECTRDISVRTRNLRPTAIHSFFRYAAFELPTHGLQIQRVLAIPSKRFVRKQVGFLNRDEVDALLDAPDRSSWSGRRDYAFILTAVQTGLRVSEIIQLGRVNLELGASAHLRVIGKGRKERCVPLAVSTRNVLKAWLLEPQRIVSKSSWESSDHSRRAIPAWETSRNGGASMSITETQTGDSSSVTPYNCHGLVAGWSRSFNNRTVARACLSGFH